MNFLTNILGVLGSGFNSLFGLITSNMQKGFQAAIQFHKEGIAFARDMGMSAKQAQAYTQTLIERTQVLANRYGVSAEAIAQVQRGLSEATGKQLMLNNAQAESIVQIDKLVGAQTRARFQEEMMNGMGGQIDTANKALANVYATAAKHGLTAKKFSDKVAQNLGMVNRLSFRNGVDGLTRMAAMSEKLGINMASVETAAGQFMDLDKAIENAAQMQMLGGSAAVNFGNPLTAAFEANNDPEAFAKRMSDSLASYATFDKNKGVANVSGPNMDYVRNIAKIMGISVEDATKMAKKQAEVRYKENALGDTLDRVAGGDTAKRDYILNNAQVTNGGRDLEINGKNVNEITDKEWEEMMRYNGMSDSEILAEQAQTLTSIDEHISGAAASVAASFAEGINKYLPDIGKQIQGLGNFLSDYAKVWGADTGKVVGEAMAWINQNGETIRNVASGILNGVNKVFDFFSNNWQGLLAAIAGWKLIGKPLLSGPSGLGARAASGIGSKLKSLGRKMYKESPMDWFRQSYKWSRNPANPARVGRMKAFGGALKDSWQGASKLAKGTAILGAVGAISQGAMAQVDYNKNVAAINRGEWDRSKYSTKEEALAGAKTERNEGVGGAVGMGLGTTLGTILGGPIGGMIGGAIGEYAGKFIGKNWEKITSFITKGWEKVTRWFTSVNWAKVGETLITIFMPPVRGIIEVVKHWDDISAWVGEKWDGAMAALGKLWQGIKETWNTYVVDPFKEYVIQPIKNVVKWADENILQPVKGFFEKIKVGFERIMQGIQKFLDDPLGTMKQGVSNAYDAAKEKAKGALEGAKSWVKDHLGIEHAEGGFINNGASGEEHPVLAQKGEVILNPTQQKNFMALANDYSSMLTNNSYMNSTITSMLPKTAEVKSKPVVGEKPEYIYKPNGSETSSINGNTITVKDFNINLSGTLKLDGGNYTKNIDMNALLNDYQFMNTLKEMIKTSINNDMNGGRFMNDLATMRGQVSSSSIIGR